VNSTYIASFVPLTVSAPGQYYNISQFGTNNPTLTCYRGTNYDFILNLGGHPFALRNASGDTTNPVNGTYNNDIVNGKTSGRVLFTPTSGTPNVIFYQCTVHSNMIGTINILNY
jgi:hypothetical protein